MTSLAEAVLPLIRTRRDVSRWGAANAHGRQMHHAVDLLEAAIPTTDPVEIYAVTHKTLASGLTVIARADDSSGIIGDACRRLLDLHPAAAAAAAVPPGRLVDWMIRFQFDADVDYFHLDPVAYAPALGENGLHSYRARLAEIEARLGSRPNEHLRWTAGPYEWFVLDWNAQRLAVLDRDIDAIIRTHAKDRRVAAWLEDTARALEEIGEIDLAIDWARQATDLDRGHQSRHAADYWCTLLDAHRPAESVAARLLLFRRWPSSTTAARLHTATGRSWPDYRDEVLATLAASPRDAVLFALLTLREIGLAWTLAHSLGLDDDQTWSELLKAYDTIEPLTALPIHERLVQHDLIEADAHRYRAAARRLATMRRLAAGTDHASNVDALIADLRHTHRRRPRLQQEFDRAHLP